MASKLAEICKANLVGFTCGATVLHYCKVGSPMIPRTNSRGYNPTEHEAEAQIEDIAYTA